MDFQLLSDESGQHACLTHRTSDCDLHPLHTKARLTLFLSQSVVFGSLLQVLLACSSCRVAETQFGLSIWVSKIRGELKILQRDLLILVNAPSSQETLAKFVDRQDQFRLERRKDEISERYTIGRADDVLWHLALRIPSR